MINIDNSRNKILLIVANLFICLLFIPYLWYGEDIYVRIFDNMDSNIVWLKMALESGQLFSLDGRVEQMMGGLPIHSVYGVYDISLAIFYFCGIFKGYVLCKFLMTLVAFWGMYLLLKKHILPTCAHLWILITVSLLFSILPFWSFTANVAGAPLIFFVFLNLRNKNTAFYNWAILVIYAFWSSLVITGFFILLIFACVWLFDLITKRDWNIPLFSGLALLSICYIVSHFPFFYAHFFTISDTVSIRTQFNTSRKRPLLSSLYHYGLPLFLNGDATISRHSVSNHMLMFVPILGALALMIKDKKVNKLFVVLFIYCLLTSIYYGINETSLFYPVRMWLWSIFPLNTLRCYWLNAPFWYIMLAIAFVYIAQKYSRGVYFIIVCVVVQLAFSLPQLDYLYYKRTEKIKYKDFFATAQYQDIKDAIGRPQSTYRIIHLGVDPAISLYNGFYTVDGFSIDYSIDYKAKFRKIMEKELHGEGKRNFDNWGGRCLLFTDNVSVWYDRQKAYLDRTLLFDYEQMKTLGAEYLLSANEINLEKNESLEFVKAFPYSQYNDAGDGALWNLFLYRIR